MGDMISKIFLPVLHTSMYVKLKGDTMNTKTLITRTTVTFVALALAGIAMAVSAKTLTNPLDQSILIAVGSALFGAGLAFFLVRIFALAEK